ncbi:Glycosyl transferases group 1 [uncultured archaeon]|nr:Glycosyl transferases group 1 [uncultured archaeon]
MKIVQIHKEYAVNSIGGVEEYIRFLASLKGEHFLVCDRLKGQKEFEKSKKLNIIRTKTAKTRFNQFVLEKEKLVILKNLNPDLMFIHGPTSFTGSVLLGTFTSLFFEDQAWVKYDCKKIMIFHGLPSVVLAGKFRIPFLFRLWKDIEEKNLIFSDKCIYVDKYVRNFIPESFRSKLTYIPNPVDLRTFKASEKTKSRNYLNKRFNLRLKRSDFVFSFINRFSSEKGVNSLIDFEKILNVKHKLLIVGDGPVKSPVLKVTKNGNCFYLGKLNNEDLPFVLNSSNFVFNPIRHPASSRVALESLACRVPVITTGIGDRYPVIDDKTGIIYDDLNEVPLKLKSFIYSKKNFIIINDFSSDKVILKITSIIKSLV